MFHTVFSGSVHGGLGGVLHSGHSVEARGGGGPADGESEHPRVHNFPFPTPADRDALRAAEQNLLRLGLLEGEKSLPSPPLPSRYKASKTPRIFQKGELESFSKRQ